MSTSNLNAQLTNHEAAFKKAIDIVGNKWDFASALELSIHTINGWMTGHRPVPLKCILKIECLTDHKITLKDFEPELHKLLKCLKPLPYRDAKMARAHYKTT